MNKKNSYTYKNYKYCYFGCIYCFRFLLPSVVAAFKSFTVTLKCGFDDSKTL